MSVNKSFREELDPKNGALAVVRPTRENGTNLSVSVSKDLTTSYEARRGPKQQAGRKMVVQGNHWILPIFTPKT